MLCNRLGRVAFEVYISWDCAKAVQPLFHHLLPRFPEDSSPETSERVLLVCTLVVLLLDIGPRGRAMLATLSTPASTVCSTYDGDFELVTLGTAVWDFSSAG